MAMSQATRTVTVLKCDRCETEHHMAADDYKPAGWVTMKVPMTHQNETVFGAHTDNVDLCRTCADSLAEWFTRF
jgi:hypothetical protein